MSLSDSSAAAAFVGGPATRRRLTSAPRHIGHWGLSATLVPGDGAVAHLLHGRQHPWPGPGPTVERDPAGRDSSQCRPADKGSGDVPVGVPGFLRQLLDRLRTALRPPRNDALSASVWWPTRRPECLDDSLDWTLALKSEGIANWNVRGPPWWRLYLLLRSSRMMFSSAAMISDFSTRPFRKLIRS